MTLSVKEKDHWKNRISSRIDRAIEDMYRREGSRKRKEIQLESRERVLDNFAIRDKVERFRILQEEVSRLALLRSKINDEIMDQLKELGFRFGYGNGAHVDLDAFINAQARLCEREVLLETEFGRRIVRLWDEQDQLLDTVWLATSSNQIKRLWQEMASLLGEQPTELQQQALMNDSDNSTE